MGGFSVYGLGILLTLEDKVSDKLGGVGNSLQNLSIKAMSLNYMGKSLMNTGKALLSPIVGLSKEVVRVSSDAEKARVTLGALYGSAESGAKKYSEIVEYAAKTPFEITELRDASLQFKTLGVELIGAGSEVTSTSGKTRQFMDILGDMGAGLSGVARNGFKDVTYAVREFVTEGNKLSFLRRLGVDIDAVLTKAGKTVGNTVEERLKNMADLAEILHFEGLTDKMFGTWSQVISNMDDLWTMFCLGVGDTAVGIFENDEFGNTVFGGFKRTLDKVQQVLKKINLVSFGEAVGKGLYSIMQPLDVIASKLVDVVGFVIDLVSQHPNIAKYALLLPTIAGALFLVAGAALVAQSSMMVFGYGLGVVISMIPKALLLAGLFAVIKTAWTKDIGGIRTRLTGFVNTVNTSFSKAKEILALSTDDMIKSYNDLVEQYSKTGDFGAGLTAGIIRTAKLWGAFVDFWNDSTLSQENLKILNEMGLMPVFEKIATWTEKFKAFFKGVTEGFSEMANAVGDFVNNIMTKFFPTLETGNGQGLFDAVTGKFNGGDLSGVENMGKTAMKLLPTVLGLIKIAKLIHKHNNSGRNGGGITGLLSRILGGRGNNPDGGDTGGMISSLRKLGNTLASLNPMQILRGLVNLGIIMTAFMGLSTIFGGFVNLFGVGTIGKGIAALGALSVAMLPLGTPAFNTLINTLQRLARFKVKTLGKGILNLGVIVGGIAAISAISLSLMAIPLAFMDVGTMYAMVGVLSLMGALGVALAYFSGIVGNIPVTTVLLGLANMAIMIGGMTALFMILGAVAMIPFDIGRVAQITLILGMLGIIGTALALFAGIVGVIPVPVVALGLANMAIMLGGLALLYMILGAVSLIPFDIGRIAKLVMVIGLIGTVGTALSLFAGIAGILPTTLVLKGIANISLALAGFGVLAYAFSYATKYADQIEQGCEIISKIAGGIGKAVGSLVGGLLEGVTNSLPKVGENLAGFVTNLNPLISLAKNKDATQIGTFFKSLGDGLLALTKNDILSFFTGGTDFVSLAEDLSGFATALVPFFAEVAKVDDSGLSKAPAMFKSLEGINNQAFMSGGVNDWWNGSIDLTNLGTQLSNFAGAIAPFFNAVAGINESAFTKAESMFKSLEGINKQAFMSGGVNDWWNGKIDLTNLGSMLSNFASSAGTFWTTVATWDESAFSKAESMFTALKGINDQAFMSGGVNDFWNGSIDLSGLGKMLSNFATNASIFFQKVQAFENPERISMIFNALKDVSNLNGVQSGNLPTLGTNLSTFMSNASSFFTKAKTVDTSGLTAMATALQEFFNIINSVVITGLTNLSGSITSVVSSLSSVNAQLLIMGSGFITVGSYAITAGGMVVVSLTMMATTSVATTSIIILSFTQLGQGIFDSALVVTAGMMLMYMGVYSGCSLIIAAIASMCSTVRSQLSSLASSGYSYGSQLSSSIAAGISANSGVIRAAVQSAISSAVSSATINIPSVKIGHNALGTSNWAGGLTEINERGGEIVDLPRGTRIYPHDDSVTMAFDEGMRTAIDSMRGNSNDNRQYDNSVYFSAGSIVVQVANASEAEAERFAELVMKKIEMKKRRKAIATYAY